MYGGFDAVSLQVGFPCDFYAWLAFVCGKEVLELIS